MMRKLGTSAICTILAAVICLAQDVVSVSTSFGEHFSHDLDKHLLVVN
jgi:hypothetical protein